MTEAEIETELELDAQIVALYQTAVTAVNNRSVVAEGTNPNSVTVRYNGAELVTTNPDLIEDGRVASYANYTSEIVAALTAIQALRAT